VNDLDLSLSGDKKTVTGIQAEVTNNGKNRNSAYQRRLGDIVFALTGSMTEHTALWRYEHGSRT